MPPSAGVQASFPKLPEAGSLSHISILSEWIRICDHTHQCCREDATSLPTRLIDVGANNGITVRLCCETQDQGNSVRYIALSHRWGPKTQNMFCTYKENLKKFKESIILADLPQTFQDAIRITRGLGIQYLWIDSLCIIQDDALDWDREAKLMERVFSSAYVTIAASCATGIWDGFLKARLERQYVTMAMENGTPYYLCDTIDDFRRDVDESELNTRGWVLQERVLSRRTIYFTDRQSYWECGDGIRCETLTRSKKYASRLPTGL
jgi:hypothetical protein